MLIKSVTLVVTQKNAMHSMRRRRAKAKTRRPVHCEKRNILTWGADVTAMSN